MISEQIYKLRKSNGWSQELLAEKLNVSRQTLSKWELNESKPNIDKLILIKNLFDVKYEDLLDEWIEKLTDVEEVIRMKNVFFSDILLFIWVPIYTTNTNFSKRYRQNRPLQL